MTFKHNNIQHNDIKYNVIQHNDIQHNDILHNDLICETQQTDFKDGQNGTRNEAIVRELQRDRERELE